MNSIGSENKPLEVAIIGSGPSGYYAAQSLFGSEKKINITMFDRLPTPYGLVRGGVAPDHQKIKNVIRVYEKISISPGFQFIGNVLVGKDISIDDLRNNFHATIFACGAETDRKLGIPYRGSVYFMQINIPSVRNSQLTIKSLTRKKT